MSIEQASSKASLAFGASSQNFAINQRNGNPSINIGNSKRAFMAANLFSDLILENTLSGDDQTFIPKLIKFMTKVDYSRKHYLPTTIIISVSEQRLVSKSPTGY